MLLKWAAICGPHDWRRGPPFFLHTGHIHSVRARQCGISLLTAFPIHHKPLFIRLV